MFKAILLLVVLFLTMLLPYLPGQFDASAAPLSFMAQIASYASLLFVPAGLAWMIDRRRARLWQRVVLVIAIIIILVTVLAAAAANHLSMGVVLGTIAMLFVLRTRKQLKADQQPAPGIRDRAPLYLVLVPVLLVAFRTTAVTRAAEWSAGRAIQHSAALIADIESFRERNGHYPISLQSLNRDFPTGVMGIERFLYEPNGDAYNLFFIRQSIQLDAKEVVIFNPRDEHRFTSHELDILQYTGDELDRRRGDRRRTPLAHPQWISILFD